MSTARSSSPSGSCFTWTDPGNTAADAPLITVTLDDLGERTRMTFRLDGYDGQPGDDNVYDGWDQAFDVLVEHLG